MWGYVDSSFCNKNKHRKIEKEIEKPILEKIGQRGRVSGKR
jgi:hypothetical protein